MAEIELISYIPKTGSYKIFYPKHFSLNETDDDIVTITSPETYSNLTLTGYQASLEVDEKILTDFFQEFTEDYNPLSAISKENTSKRLLLEQKFERNNISWLWWGLAEENQIVLISANSEEELSQDDYNLYKYMIDRMEIYPSAFEE
jgi:hypothetical protein